LEGRGYAVIAAVRSSPDSIGSCKVIKGVDVNEEGSLKPLEEELSGKKVSMLVIPAGAQEVDKLADLTKDTIRRQMETNAIGPLLTVKQLQHSLAKGSKVVIVSSKMGSITEVEATGGEMYGYRMSKAAVNMAGKVLAGDLKQEPGALVALVHPGVVFTDMVRSLRRSRGVAEDMLALNTLTPEESASRILKVADGLNAENSGSFWAADTGKILGW